jgi:hypothetical protein
MTDMANDLATHLFGSGPKRILALDGGGIRGILTLQLLRKIEEILRERHDRPDMVLSDYFDLIGGTSTGAIIASALALGWSVERIDEVYRAFGNEIFDSSFFRRGLLHPKFSAKAIRKGLDENFGDIRLGGPELVTGLAIIAKRLDTGSPWIMHNNPKGKYFAEISGSGSTPNRDFLLRDVVRASAAAPTFFEPELIRVTSDLEGAFVDGGVSPYNNPSLQLLMMATLKGYGLTWPLGEENVFLVSLGTGAQLTKLDPQSVMKMAAAELGVRGLASIMDDAAALTELVMQWLSQSPTSRPIDSEVGNLDEDVLGGKAQLSYVRYNVEFDPDWLNATLGLHYSADQLESIAQMDNPKNMDDLTRIGDAATKLIAPDHFPARFDIA